MTEFLNDIPALLEVFIKTETDGTLTGVIPSVMQLFMIFPLSLFLGLTVISFAIGTFHGLFRGSRGE